MKNLAASVFLAALAIGVTLTGGCAQNKTAAIEDISAREAFDLIQDNQNNPDLVIIDVRTPAEFAEEHIENATNINFYSDTFRDTLNNLDKNKTYIVYCAVGGRSGSALDIMAKLNFREAYNIVGGINQWKAEGLPTVE